jgi:hypothetical protein
MLLHHGASVQIDNTSVYHQKIRQQIGDARAEETLSTIRGVKTIQQRRSAVQELGFSPVKQGALTYKLPVVGLCKLKVQRNHGPYVFCQN